MGRSVSYPSNTLILTFAHYETGEEVTQDLIDDGIYEQDQLGEWIDNEHAYDDMIEDFVETCKATWPSLYECDEWIGREDHVLLRNRFVNLGMSEYCGVIAYWAVLDENLLMDACYYDGRDMTGLATRWAAQIAPTFERYFGSLRKLGHMSNGEGVYERIAA